jgi:hypothetical protein
MSPMYQAILSPHPYRPPVFFVPFTFTVIVTRSINYALFSLVTFPFSLLIFIRDKWVPVTTAWRVLRLRMEERPVDMEGSCECIE